MARKTTKKSVETGSTAPAVSPFAETVKINAAEGPSPAPERRSIKVGKPVPSIENAVEPAAEKRTVKVKPVPAAGDPFAQIAGTAPAKPKRRSASTRAVAKAPSSDVRPPIKKKAAAKKPAVKKGSKVTVVEAPAVTTAAPPAEISPVFAALHEVTLPALKKDNRARLLLQSPTRAYFYWSVRQDPWQQLRTIFGDASHSYSLVVRLTEQETGREELYAAEPEGERWLEVRPDRTYAAEVGFFAPNRPYFRIVYSNTIQTPRRSPSRRPASDARWTVSANKFAEVLDVSGFTRDAVDVAIAGDDIPAADDATYLAFSSMVGGGDFTDHSAEDLRYAMVSIAAGLDLDAVRARVGAPVFAALTGGTEKPTRESSRAALKSFFKIDESEWSEEEIGPAVHGASLVHFPKTLMPRRSASTFSPRYNPVSSHSIG